MGHGQKGYGLSAMFCSFPRFVRQASKARALEGVNMAKVKVTQRVQRYAKPGKDGQQHGQEVANVQPNAPLEIGRYSVRHEFRTQQGRTNVLE